VADAALALLGGVERLLPGGEQAPGDVGVVKPAFIGEAVEPDRNAHQGRVPSALAGGLDASQSGLGVGFGLGWHGVGDPGQGLGLLLSDLSQRRDFGAEFLLPRG
jgi:hypothetical protein